MTDHYGTRLASIPLHMSLACEGVTRDLECAGCRDDACECECHFDPEDAYAR